MNNHKNQGAEGVDESDISNFYKNIRLYWEKLSKSSSGELSCMLNFGYWSNSATSLFQAQNNFLKEIISLLPWNHELNHGLEIGCGIGGISINLLKAHENISITALDISQDQLNIGKKNAALNNVGDRIKFCHGNAMNLPFQNNSFDFTVCIESTFHYKDKASFFLENFRILKPGGFAIIADITCEDVDKIKYRHGNYFDSVNNYIDYALKAGFTVELCKDIGEDVFEPLHEYIINFNRLQRMPSSKYWSVVLNNYSNLSKCGLMGYQVFLFKKPG
jgi:ubiquinone/menaquinone biosynthesis C-methylase UbiE